MKNTAYQKSSFSLPLDEVPRVNRLKKSLKLKSNTEVIRLALRELENQFNRELLKRKFLEASEIVSGINRKEIQEMDSLAGEGIDED